MIKDGTNFQPRRFERNTGNPNQMRNLAIEALTVPRKKQRQKRHLRRILPAWLSGKATQAAQQMKEEME